MCGCGTYSTLEGITACGSKVFVSQAFVSFHIYCLGHVLLCNRSCGETFKPSKQRISDLLDNLQDSPIVAIYGMSCVGNKYTMTLDVDLRKSRSHIGGLKAIQHLHSI